MLRSVFAGKRGPAKRGAGKEGPVRGSLSGGHYTPEPEGCQCKQTAGGRGGCYFFVASGVIFSMTIARDPPRWKTLPLAVTLSPANFINFGFWPAAGVALGMGQ